MVRRRWALIGFCLFLGVWPIGCGRGSKFGLVEGTLKYRGKPLAKIEVQFLPDFEKGTKGPRSTAITDEEGHFTLVCDDRRPGAVVGNHRVVLIDTMMAEQMAEATKGKNRKETREIEKEMEKVRPRIPSRYSAAATTTLLQQVFPGPQTIDLQIK